MSLTSQCAFVGNPLWIKTRALTIVGAMLDEDRTELDNEGFYQWSNVTKQSLGQAEASDPWPVISLYHTLTRLLPYFKLQPDPPYGQFVWVAIRAISISSTVSYPYACELLMAAVRCLIKGQSIHSQMNAHLYEDSRTMIRGFENTYSISFDNEFSLSLAYILFIGVRPSSTKEAYKKTVTYLMEHTITNVRRVDAKPNDNMRPIHPEVLGFFMGLLPFMMTQADLRNLIRLADGGEQWAQSDSESESQDQRMKTEKSFIRLPIEVFGNMQPRTALLICSFACMMLKTCSVYDPEATMLYTLLADLSGRFPDIVGIW